MKARIKEKNIKKERESNKSSASLQVNVER